MGLRAIGVVLPLATLAFATAGVAMPATEATHPCDRPGATVVKNRFVRVYHDEDLFACSYESRRTVSVGFVASSSSGFFDSFGFELAGRFVAYNRVECIGSSGAACVDELRVVDMGRLKQTMRHRFAEDDRSRRVVLKANGSVAYLVTKTDPYGHPTGFAALHRRDRRGRWTLAAGTGDAAPRDLRLVGSTLHWREGERERTKTLQ